MKKCQSESPWPKKKNLKHTHKDNLLKSLSSTIEGDAD